MKVYLSGAITKDPDYISKFKNIENTLKKLGFTVVNPVELCHGLTGYIECFKLDIQEMLLCDVVCNINDGIESLGRELELIVAEALNMQIISSSEMCKYHTPKSVLDKMI